MLSWHSGRQNGGVTRWHPVALISCANCNQIVTIGISRESRRRPRRRIESPAAPGVDALPPRRHGPRIAPRHGLAYGLPIASGAFGGLSRGQRLPASPTTAYRGGRGQGLPHVRTRHGPRPATAPGRHRPGPPLPAPAPLDAATVPATVSTAPPKATAPRCPASDHPGDLAPRVPHSGFPAMGTLRRPGSTCCPLSRRRYRPRRPAWTRCPWTRHGSRAPRPDVPHLEALPPVSTPYPLMTRPSMRPDGPRGSTATAPLRPRYGPALDGDRYGATATPSTPTATPTGSQGAKASRRSHRRRRASPGSAPSATA